jgi:hypothetical protein
MNPSNQLSTNQIDLFANPRGRVSPQSPNFLGLTFVGTHPSDAALRLLKRGYADKSIYDRQWGLIFNVDPNGKPGTHWLALYHPDKSNKVELFDSYGLKSKADFLKHYPHLGEFLDYVTLSDTPGYQSRKSYVCGHYCLAYLYCKVRNLSLGKVFKLKPSSRIKNDKRICQFVCNVMIYSDILRDKIAKASVDPRKKFCQGCCCKE